MKIVVLIQSLGKSASENRPSQASYAAVYAVMWGDDDKNSSSEIKPGVDGPMLLLLSLLLVVVLLSSLSSSLLLPPSDR